MDLGVAVDLGGRGEDEAGALLLRQAEHVVRPVGADLERVQRQPQIVDRARGRGEVVDEVDRLLDEQRLGEVVLDERELRRADVVDVLQRPGVEVVDADHPVAVGEQMVAQMRAEKSRPSRNDARAHRVARIPAAGARGTWGGLALGVDVAPGRVELANAAVELLERHESALRRVARRISLCPDDADDAIQNALEILLTKAPTDERRRLIAWMTVVTRQRHSRFAARASGR